MKIYVEHDGHYGVYSAVRHNESSHSLYLNKVGLSDPGCEPVYYEILVINQAADEKHQKFAFWNDKYWKVVDVEEGGRTYNWLLMIKIVGDLDSKTFREVVAADPMNSRSGRDTHLELEF